MREGEVVLDWAARRLLTASGGQRGRACRDGIGVDMTPEMIETARGNADRGGYQNVEFRLGEIEHLPVADASVDVVISNCVINLVPDKPQAFAEAFRVLRPGGRLHVSDIVLGDELPAEYSESVAAYVSCVAGAASREDYLAALRSAGFEQIEVVSERDALGLLKRVVAAPHRMRRRRAAAVGEAVELREAWLPR